MAGLTEPEDIRGIARVALEKCVSSFSDEAALVVEKELGQVDITYSSVRCSALGDPTCMRLSLRPDAGEMWIGSVRVAASFRSLGLGRELVEAEEEIAHETGVSTIKVMPLGPAQTFWRKMGYGPDCRTARVLSKDVGGQRARRPRAHDCPRHGSGDGSRKGGVKDG